MKTKTKLGFILIILFQIFVLIGWAGYNEISIATGKEVVLQTAPVDPTDIFRGEYVQLSYEISRLQDIPGTSTLESGDWVYVQLEQQGEVWRAVQVSKTKPGDGAIFIAGKVGSSFPRVVVITYGIESYFVPEGKGMEIQNARDIKVRVALNGAGQAFIKGLIVDGQPFQLK